MNTANPLPRFSGYQGCLNWVSDRWHSPDAIEAAAMFLEELSRQRDLLDEDQRLVYEKLICSSPWQINMATTTKDQVPALRWIDTPSEAELACRLCDGRPLHLSVSTLAPDVAAVLATYQGELVLPGLVRIDDPNAKALSKRPEREPYEEPLPVTLGIGLESIDSFQCLEPLWSRPDAFIKLPAFQQISDEAAQILGRTRGTLCLPNISILTVRQARLLVGAGENGQGPVCLELGGLTDAALTPDLAAALCEGNVAEMVLNGINGTAAGLPVIARHRWSVLQLDGISRLSESVAEDLGKAGMTYLLLNGITRLDVATAIALCGEKRTVRLFLNGLSELDDKVVGILTRDKTSLLEIRNAKGISDAAKAMIREANVEWHG